jgi:hypothetical protein
MIAADLGALVLLLSSLVAAAPASQPTRDGGCTEWRECRQMALAAADRGEYETFHDLTWRAVQTGPRNDPALMYLLARAQALSGRQHDALVMLQRLADMGVPSDAVTNDEFRYTRDLPGWPAVAARIERVNSDPSIAVPVPTTGAATSPPAPSAPPAPAETRAPIAEAVRFSTGRFTVGGLAYDAVSQRFLFGDRLGRKVIVVGEGSSHPVDLVRAESAGFHEISAVEIDAKRGDLWVASTAPDTAAGTLHRLQLVSGRPLRKFPIGADFEPVRLVDLAVTPSGAVLLLDARSRQLLVLHSGATSLERVARIDAAEPASVAAEGDELFAYVAHRDGVSRIDLQKGTMTAVAAPKSVSLARIERIRRHRGALIAVQVDTDGSRRIVRLDLNAGGTAVIRGTTLEASVPTATDTHVTISGDELLYVASVPGNSASPSDQPPGGTTEFVAYRLRIRN